MQHCEERLYPFARVIAAEGGKHGITANVITPGLIATEGVRERHDIAAVKGEVLPLQSVQRFGQPADIAECGAERFKIYAVERYFYMMLTIYQGITILRERHLQMSAL